MEALGTQIRVPPDTGQLSDLRARLFLLCEESGVPSQTTRRMVLAVDEAVANVIEHGLKGRSEDVLISFDVQDREITATIRDRGVPFNPVSHTREPHGGSHPRDLPRRGFGLYLIHLIVDGIDYYRTDAGENVLVLKKRI
jgi:serine/threonine-protein kinase RsbW